jgi:hypothetical protein
MMKMKIRGQRDKIQHPGPSTDTSRKGKKLRHCTRLAGHRVSIRGREHSLESKVLAGLKLGITIREFKLQRPSFSTFFEARLARNEE